MKVTKSILILLGVFGILISISCSKDKGDDRGAQDAYNKLPREGQNLIDQVVMAALQGVVNPVVQGAQNNPGGCQQLPLIAGLQLVAQKLNQFDVWNNSHQSNCANGRQINCVNGPLIDRFTRDRILAQRTREGIQSQFPGGMNPLVLAASMQCGQSQLPNARGHMDPILLLLLTKQFS